MTKSQTFTVFTPEIWSPRVTGYFKENLVAGKFFADYSADLDEGGDILHIPNRAQRFSVADIKVTSGDVSATNVSDTSTTLTIDKWKGAAFFISDFQAKQIHNKYRILNDYAKDLGHDLAKTFDSALWDETSNITDGVGDSATDLLSTSLEKAISIVESNSIPMKDVAFFFHPYAYWREVMKIQKYYDASQAGWGAGQAPMVGAARAKGALYGIPVFVEEQIPAGTAGSEGGHRNLLVHREAVAYAVQLPVSIKELKSESLRRKIVGDISYGVSALRDAGVRIISNN